jgi:hypothetical protein
MTFADDEDMGARTTELATHTLPYFLADDATRLRLIEVFRSIGDAITANTNGDQSNLIRRSPLPPAAVAELQTWLAENLDTLRAAAAEDRLFAELSLPRHPRDHLHDARRRRGHAFGDGGDARVDPGPGEFNVGALPVADCVAERFSDGEA